ncbi:hypothetical protein Q1695_006306 [Nippostrongylus brasiliensis]|nr:hypothetical protein Q1695_006306 [Nippostrongylus brasiliensis]
MPDRNTLDDRTQFEFPPLFKALHSSFALPFLAYFACFRLVSLFVKTFMWQSFPGFKGYRLQNLTVCLLHSVISGVWTTVFFIFYPQEMFDNVIHWYEPWAAQLPIISIAYFVHDAIDMLHHEWTRWTMELIIHHIATCFALLVGVISGKFLLADYWALLMEGNSIFLHTRTIMQISELSLVHPKVFAFVVNCNVASFILYRFISQALWVRWAVSHINQMHPLYVCVALGGPVVFLVINMMLFFRVLVSDGFLDKRWRSKAAINRYALITTNITKARKRPLLLLNEIDGLMHNLVTLTAG